MRNMIVKGCHTIIRAIGLTVFLMSAFNVIKSIRRHDSPISEHSIASLVQDLKVFETPFLPTFMVVTIVLMILSVAQNVRRA